MTKPQQPQSGDSAKAGVTPGSTAATDNKGGKRPVDEEDVFGGAERTQNDDVKSGNAKP